MNYVRRSYGFTLIELMIVVVIIGVLASIAYPSYTKYMKQTRRSDAQIALSTAASLQEKFYSDCSHYAQKLEGLKLSRACGTVGNSYNDGILSMNNSAATTILSPGLHYAVSLVTPTASSGTCPITSCFILQATPATTAQGGTGLQLTDGNFRITSAGVKTWDKSNNSTYAAKWTDK
jgi:type IV pilus assembly protein PilE